MDQTTWYVPKYFHPMTKEDQEDLPLPIWDEPEVEEVFKRHHLNS